VRGLDTGAENAVTLGETGTNLGLSQPASLFQAAQDSSVLIDGFTVTRPTNQIVGALSGVTLALTAETTTPVTVTVASDPQGLQTKLQSVVDSYNAIVSKIHQTAGFGSTKGTDPVLQGDSTLRSITSRLTRVFQSTVAGSGTYETLGSIGLSLNRDGTLGVDATKLTKALQTDASSVTRVLAGAGDGAGAMDTLSSLVKGMTQSGGVIDARKEALESRAKSLRERADREEDRLNRYADTLRKQFTAMDTTVASNNSQLEYLIRLYSG
jgi:flagellar hook-associated protein 2